MTTACADIAPTNKPRKKKKLPDMFHGMPLHASMDAIVDAVVEGIGGKDYLAALFANDVLGEKVKGEKDTFWGKGKYADRKHRVVKQANGKYRIERV